MMNLIAVKIIAVLLIIAIIIVFSLCVFLHEFDSTDGVVYNNAFYEYSVYIHKGTGEVYIYNHGHLEPLLGADGSPITTDLGVCD